VNHQQNSKISYHTITFPFITLFYFIYVATYLTRFSAASEAKNQHLCDEPLFPVRYELCALDAARGII
jgi:hypothetical protein